MKPDDQTIEILRNIKTEIGAGMVLIPRTPEERAHNNACARALTIVSNYQRGEGLFQMVADQKARHVEPTSVGVQTDFRVGQKHKTEKRSD